MKIGVSLLFQNVHDDLPDGDVIKGDVDLAILADELGFDYVSCVEHHFDSYSMCPDNFQILAYIAAKTKNIELQTGAVILPWNDPLRVAEHLIVLDHLSDGRVAFGAGRGLAKMEYEGFGEDMNESRERFDESLAMVMKALETGYIEGEGPFYKQEKTKLRPEPRGSFEGRTFSVAMSPSSAEAAAEAGTAMLLFPSKPIEQEAEGIEAYRRRFEESHGTKAPNVTFSDLTYCDSDSDLADRIMLEYGLRQHHSFYGHYSIAGDHWDSTKGYESYQAITQALLNTDAAASTKVYNDVQAYGTPEQIIETVRERVEILGPDMNTTFNFSWGGIPYEKVESSIRLFAKEALPELKEIEKSAVA